MRISDWSSDVCSSDLPGPGGAGDAIITIEIKPHPFFERDGNNVRLNLPVTLDEAVNGARVKVPTVDGPVMLGIPAGRSEEHTSELQSLMRISYAVFCLKKKKQKKTNKHTK